MDICQQGKECGQVVDVQVVREVGEDEPGQRARCRRGRGVGGCGPTDGRHDSLDTAVRVESLLVPLLQENTWEGRGLPPGPSQGVVGLVELGQPGSIEQSATSHQGHFLSLEIFDPSSDRLYIKPFWPTTNPTIG